jgi:hypothetical protein
MAIMRISKYPPIFGVGIDCHMALPPSLPTVPPAPFNPAIIPKNVYVVAILPYTQVHKITGKWSNESVQTEGMGDILFGYDWGPTQVHLAVYPAIIVTPSAAVTTFTSSVKYWLPSYAVQEKVDGGAMAKVQGGSAAVAVSFPCSLISTQDCEDIAGNSFVAPTSISHQSVSRRWIGFHGGDILAGCIALLGDAACAFIVSNFGGKLFPGVADNQIFGALAGYAVNILQMCGTKAVFAVAAGHAGFFTLVGLGRSAGVAMVGPMVATVAGLLADAVGGSPRPGDVEGTTPAASSASAPSSAPTPSNTPPPSSATPPPTSTTPPPQRSAPASSP